VTVLIAPNNNIVYKNIVYLLAVQGVNALFPLLLVPYISRVLGVENYGSVAFGLSLASFAYVLTDYGFGLYVTQKIAKAHSNYAKIRDLVGATLALKSILVVVAIVCLVLLKDLMPPNHRGIITSTIILMVGQSYIPIWFFQGVERMKALAIINVCSKAIYVVIVLVAVRSPSDGNWALLGNAASCIAASAVGFFWMIRMGYRPTWVGWRFCWNLFQGSTEYFWSRVAVTAYTAGCVVYLGFASSPLELSYYVAAEQVYKGLQTLFSPLPQALYPAMVRSKDFRLLFRFTAAVVILSIIGFFTSLAFLPFVISAIYGTAFSPAVSVLAVFMATIGISCTSTILGYPLFGALEKLNVANRTVFVCGGLQIFLLLTCFLSGNNSALALAWVVFTVEAVCLLVRGIWGGVLYRNRTPVSE
jgi:PST family polysaccharide transporter